MALYYDQDAFQVNIWQTFIHTGTLRSVLEVLTALTSLRSAI